MKPSNNQLTGVIDALKRLRPAPFVGENIEIHTIKGVCIADLLVICPTGIFLGAREEKSGNIQQALITVIGEAWGEDDHPAIRSVPLTGDPTRILNLIENAKDEVSKEGSMRLLDFLGVRRSELAGTWLETEAPAIANDDHTDKNNAADTNADSRPVEPKNIQEQSALPDSHATRTKKQSRTILGIIVGILAIAGVVLWLIYPRFIGTSTPGALNQESPPPLFVGSGSKGNKVERPGTLKASATIFSGTPDEAKQKTPEQQLAKAANAQTDGKQNKTEAKTQAKPTHISKEEPAESPIISSPKNTPGNTPEQSKEQQSQPGQATTQAKVQKRQARHKRPKSDTEKTVGTTFNPAPRPQTRPQRASRLRSPQRPQVASIPRASTRLIPQRPAEPGLYETIRLTEAKESPEQGARTIDQIPQGIKLNVTGSQGGWLVVRSKTRNRTAYVRRTDAMRLANRRQQQQSDTSVPESKWPEIEKRIAQAVAQRGVNGIRVTFIGDTAYLKGIVKSEINRDRAELAAGSILEVRNVSNMITVDKSWNPFSGLFGGGNGP